MPLQVENNASEVRVRIRLTDASNLPVSGIAFDSPNLSLAVMGYSDIGFTVQSLNGDAGTVGVYASNSWLEIDDGVYEYCLPDSYLESGYETIIRAKATNADPWRYARIWMTAYSSLDMDQATPAGSTLGDQLDLISDVANEDTTVVPGSEFDQGNPVAQWPEQTLVPTTADSTNYKSTDWLITFDDVGFIDFANSGAEMIRYAIKSSLDDDDDSAVVLINMVNLMTPETTILRINGAASGNVTDSTITYSSYTVGGVTKYRTTVFIRDDITSQFATGDYYHGIKQVGDGRVMSQGTITISEPIIDAIT